MQQQRPQLQQVNGKLEQRQEEESEMVSRYVRLLTDLGNAQDPRTCLQSLARIQRQLPRLLLHRPEWSVVHSLPDLVTEVIHATYHDQYIYAVLTSAGEEHVYRLPAKDLKTGRWVDVKVPPAGPAKYHGFISHAGSLYILYAAASDLVSSLYKRVDGNWVFITHLPEREHFAFGVANSKLFIVGGMVQGRHILKADSLSLAEENAAAEEWESWPDLPVPCMKGRFVCFGKQVCVIGRQDLSPKKEERYVLSIDATTGPDSHGWSHTALPLTDYVYSGACRLHSTVAIAGGMGGPSFLGLSTTPLFDMSTTSSFIFDTKTNEWAPLADLNKPRACTNLLFDHDRNRLICIGGISVRRNTFCNTMEVLQL